MAGEVEADGYKPAESIDAAGLPAAAAQAEEMDIEGQPSAAPAADLGRDGQADAAAGPASPVEAPQTGEATPDPPATAGRGPARRGRGQSLDQICSALHAQTCCHIICKCEQ